MKKHLPFYLYLFLFFAELTVILVINHGRFIYTLDDPYIHLSLAEHIARGHFGVNTGEFASPASSIIWPFILAPFEFLGSAEYIPLILNFLFSLITINFFIKALSLFFDNKLTMFFSSVMMLASNLVSLTYGGMEHSLHVMLTVIFTYYLLLFLKTDRINKFAFVLLAAAPLVRYEGLVISVPLLLFFFYKGYRKESLITIVSIAIMLISYSLFLLSLGLPYLPLSILMKTLGVYDFKAELLFPLFNARVNLREERYFALLLLCCAIIIPLINSKSKNNKILAAAIGIMFIFQLLFFRNDHFWRYELYLWSFYLMILFYAYEKHILDFIKFTGERLIAVTAVALFIIIASYPYINILRKIPYASANIYEQQYQIHRFITEHYKMPVAITDLGWTSYQNENYILDLWGLGSVDTYKAIKYGQNSEWAADLLNKKKIKLLVCYDIIKNLPKSYIYAAKLTLHHPRKSAAIEDVYFIVTDSSHVPYVKEKLKSWRQTVPEYIPVEIY